MLEADGATAFTHRRVEVIARRWRAEFGGVSLAEALDRFGREPRFAHRHEVERAQLRGRALRLRIEGADQFQRVAEKIEANRRRSARRIKVEDASARRVIADVAHRAGARIAIRLEPAREVFHAHAIAGRGRESCGFQIGERRRALRQRADRAHENARPLDRAAALGEPRQHGHALGRNRSVGGDAVIGLAVPRREMQGFDLGGGEGKRVDDVLRPHAVSRHDDERDGARFARRGERAREIGDDKGIVTLGRARERDGVALSKTPCDGIDEIHAPLSARLSASRGAAQRRAKSGVSCSTGIASDPVIQSRICGSGISSRRSNSSTSASLMVGQIHVRELAHHEIHFSDASAPGAKQNLPPALVERCAGEDGPGHEASLRNDVWPNVVTAGLDPPIHGDSAAWRSTERNAVPSKTNVAGGRGCRNKPGHGGLAASALIAGRKRQPCYRAPRLTADDAIFQDARLGNR